MRYTLLGKSGVRISDLALGTMTFGEDWGSSEETSARMLDRYAEAGGNVLDTANVYTGGHSEEILGALLRGRRDEFVVATKYTTQTRAGDLNSAGNHRKNLVSAVEASLQRLRTDRIDLLWVHLRDTLTPVPEVMRALDDQVRAGKVLYVGASDWPAWEVAQANTLADLKDWSPFVGLQLRYNLLDRSPELELTSMARGFDLAVFAWGPLAQGRLTGKYLRAGHGRLSQDGTSRPGPHNDETIRQVTALAEEIGCTPAQVALAWLRQRPGLVIPIVGATSEAQLANNLASAEVTLTSDQITRLNQLSRPSPGFPWNVTHTERMVAFGYGDKWRDVDDRRTTVRRVPNDAVDGLATAAETAS